jgi:purine-binding chemotaxis protein CheW
MTSSYLIFLLAGRPFGVKLLGALEILPWRASRSVPLSYSYVEGLLDYRGAVYPVFNPAQRLGVSAPGPIGFTAEEKARAGAGKSILLLQVNEESFGIIVDSVVKMTKLEEIAPTPEKTQGIDPKYIKGVVYEEDQEILIFDFERLFHAG